MAPSLLAPPDTFACSTLSDPVLYEDVSAATDVEDMVNEAFGGMVPLSKKMKPNPTSPGCN